MFHKVIESLVRVADHFEIIDQILNSHESLQAVYRKTIEHTPMPCMLLRPTSENIKNHFKRPVSVEEAYLKKNWWTNIFYKLFR